MAARTKKGERFEFKAGLEGFKWGGMQTEGDPSANDPWRPRLLENVSFVGGEMRERAGLTKFLASQLHVGACVRYLGDFQISTPRKLWIVTDGCPGISSGAGSSITCIDTEQDPEFQRVLYGAALSNPIVLAGFGADLHFGADDTLRKLQLLPVPWEAPESLSISGYSQDLPLKTWTGFVITAMLEFDGKLFIGLDNGIGASKIVTWDGVSWREDLLTIDPVTCFGLYRVTTGGDAIVAGFAGATNHIRYRPTGDSPGSWTIVAPGAGTLDARNMISYKDVLYLSDLNGDIWDFDGTTLASAHSPASSTACKAVTTFNGNLLFGYTTAAAARLGSYDGSSWTDVEKDFTVQAAEATDIRTLAGYRGLLMAGIIETVKAGVVWVTDTDITAAYDRVVMNSLPINNADLDLFVVF